MYIDVRAYQAASRIQLAKTATELAAVAADIKGMGLPNPDLDDLRAIFRDKRDSLAQVKVAGTSHRQEAVRRCQVGDRLRLVLDPSGAVTRAPHKDDDAVALFRGDEYVGNLPQKDGGWAATYAQAMRADPSRTWEAEVRAIPEGGKGILGLRVVLPVIGTPE
jgi:hypothetical protein